MKKKYKFEFVNYKQNNEERRFKYMIIRLLGYDSYTAIRFRDFRWSILERLFK